MNINEIQTYSHADLTTFSLHESVGDWRILHSNFFKKGMKKYQNDKKVMAAFKELRDFIVQHNDVPPVKSYPPHMNVHHIKRHAKFAGSMWAHLKGQQIGVLYFISKGEVQFIHIGSHQRVGL